MQRIQQAFQEVRDLHEQWTGSPAPEIGPQAFLPFPPGADPVAFAMEEVAQLRRMVAGAQTQPGWVPRCSTFAGDSGICFLIELPGVSKEDVTVTATAGELAVRGQRRPPKIEGSLRPMLVEQSWGPFECRFPIPSWCDSEKIVARCALGVLEINLSRSRDGISREHRVEID